MRLIAEYRVLNTDQLTFLTDGTKRNVQHRINVLYKRGLVKLNLVSAISGLEIFGE